MTEPLHIYVENVDSERFRKQWTYWGTTKEKLDNATYEAMLDFSKVVLRAGRRAIAQGGGKFLTELNFQNALRAKVYENNRLDSAIFVYHKIPYANIFEVGGTISGKPFLWLPTDVVPDAIKSPKQFRRFFPHIKIRSARRAGGTPMLVARFGKGRFKAKGKYVIKSVPIFVGIQVVDIPQKFGIERAIRKTMVKFNPILQRKLEKYSYYG